MSELELVGLHEDGEHLVLRGADGQRFRLAIDESLRAAVRRDRPQLEQLRATRDGFLAPREIQARIRAGGTAEQLAESTGMPLEHVRRYEGPVVDERAFLAEQAQATRVGHEVSAPVLGELVTDRLATRGVAGDSIAWDAHRPVGGAWTVEVSFRVGDGTRSARWTFDPAARTVRALDDEARWLSETDLADGPLPRRHLSAVRAEAGVDAALRPLLATVDLPVPEPEPEPDPRAETEALLEDLAGRRGVRQDIDVEADDEEFEGFGPQQVFDFEHPGRTTSEVPAAHPPASRPDEATDATVLPMPSGRGEPSEPSEPSEQPEPSTPDVTETTDATNATDATDATRSTAGSARSRSRSKGTDKSARRVDGGATAPSADEARAATGGEAEPEGVARVADVDPAPRQRQRRGRASVPSWDEIVFGAKQD